MSPYGWAGFVECGEFPNNITDEILNPLHAECLLTHWGRVTHIYVSKLIAIGSDNGLSPGRRQAIIWTNAGILLIGTLGTNFSEILIEIRIFSFKKMGLKVSSAKRRPFCLGLNVLTHWTLADMAVILNWYSSNSSYRVRVVAWLPTTKLLLARWRSQNLTDSFR